MAATATKTRRTKVDTLRPPQAIAENTKARRAWLQAELERIVRSTPPAIAREQGWFYDAKIVGTGSYQTVSVYKVEEVEGRTRHRGTCQACGGLQVVDGASLVLHGYKRPGTGETVGRCPGVAELPLQVSKDLTVAWLANARTKHAEALGAVSRAEATKDATSKALYAGGSILKGERLETGAYQAAPKAPTTRWNGFGYFPSDADLAAYKAARATWAKAYPLTAADSDATSKLDAAKREAYAWLSTVQHFEELLGRNLTGTPLVAEVVA